MVRAADCAWERIRCDRKRRERESPLLNVADYVYAAMRRPAYIIIWLIAVIAEDLSGRSMRWRAR
jgi:hypothetical protein